MDEGGNMRLRSKIWNLKRVVEKTFVLYWSTGPFRVKCRFLDHLWKILRGSEA